MYTLQVRAKNANGVSNFVTSRATTLDGPNKAPPTPTNLYVSDIRHDRATLHWTESPTATSYEIGTLSVIDIGDVDSYTLTNLEAGTAYTMFVAAKNAYGSSQNASVKFITLMAPPVRANGGSSSKSRRDDESPPPTPIPIHDSLNHLPPGIQVSNWVDGAQGKRIDHVGVGRPDLTEQGILDAVDVYGYVTPGVEVCFAAHGRLVFLDAAYAPRRLANLPAYQRDGMTCATIDRGGTVVLLQSDSPPPVSQSSQAEPTQPQSMSDCEAQPWANLKFRQSPPDGLVLSVTATRDWLPASEKRHGYFKVRLWGREGWISGDYVYLRGDCGA